MSDVESDEEQLPSRDVVLNKYKMAGDVAQRVLTEVIAKCIAGAKIVDICKFGDDLLMSETAKLFKNSKDTKKGVAYPTTISVNNIICHNSPLDDDTEELKDEDLVKIDLGAHVDGFASIVGHSIVVGANAEKKVTGRKADAIIAAHNAMEAILRLMRPEEDSVKFADVVGKIAKDFECKPIESPNFGLMQSHQMKKMVYETDKIIVMSPSEDQKKNLPKCQLGQYECWVLEVLVSTGDGKAREQTDKPITLYRKTDVVYQLKMTASRQVFSNISTKFLVYPFNMRHLEEKNKARFALSECCNHNVVQQMPVFADKEGEFVAQFKTTVLVMPNGPMRLTRSFFEPAHYSSQHKVTDAEMKNLLNQPLKKKAAAKEGSK